MQLTVKNLTHLILSINALRKFGYTRLNPGQEATMEVDQNLLGSTDEQELQLLEQRGRIAYSFGQVGRALASLARKDPHKVSNLEFEVTGLTTVKISQPQGLGSSILFTLQDDIQREMVSPITLNLSTDLDEGSKSVNTWYYMYAVPDIIDDTKLIGKFSINPPSSGPVGFPRFNTLGAIRNGSKKDGILVFSQSNGRFQYHSLRKIFNLKPAHIKTETSPVLVPVGEFVPETASAIEILARVKPKSGGSGHCNFYVDGFQNDSSIDVAQSDLGEGRRMTIPLPTSPKAFYRQIFESVGNLDVVQAFAMGWVDKYIV